MPAINLLKKRFHCAPSGRPHPRYTVDLRVIGSQSRDTRQYFAGQAGAGGILATAALIGSPISRLTGNFFLSFGKPNAPAKLFTSEEDALAWLKEFLN